MSYLLCNSHIHSPYSFSSSKSIKEIFELASKDNIKVLGLNDFFTTDGFEEFDQLSTKYKIYPLFNIEFLCISEFHQKNNIRINDINNPGRFYLVGKGLNFPIKLSEINKKLLNNCLLFQKTHIEKVLEKVNIWFEINSIKEKLNFEQIKVDFAKQFVGERHIAKAIKKILDDNPYVKIDFKKEESIIREKLLKKSGFAFIEENSKSFLTIEESLGIIKDLGGIPCYPVLLDSSGKYTEYEQDFESLHNNLIGLGINCIELIPNRNNIKNIEEITYFFLEKNYIVLFGTEHNSNQKSLLVDIPENLKKISYENCCKIASYQECGVFNFKIGDKAIKSFIQ